MRLRILAPLACLFAVFQIAQHPAAAPRPSPHTNGVLRLPAQLDTLYAAPWDANSRVGPSMPEVNARLAALQANASATTATFQVTYDNTSNTWPQNAKDAFQAAVNIWSTIVTSPSNIPITIIAKFDSNGFSPQTLG